MSCSLDFPLCVDRLHLTSSTALGFLLHNKVIRMASTIDAATQLEQKNEGSTLTELYDRLDTLWIQYLTLLDDYSTAQASIQKHLASGFFSLTQANFQSAGRRYGRDYYDGRAVATVRTKASDADGLEVLKISVAKRDEDEDATTTKEANEPSQLPSPSPTPEPEDKATSNDTDGDGTTTENADEKAPMMVDPIRWFGILTPSSLRLAQRSFASTLLEPDTAVKAVNAARGLRDVEADVRKLRKVIKKSEKAATAS